MQLIGYLDSPFVRRVAVSLEFLGLAYEHRELSIWRDFEEFSALSPLVKVPTLVCDDGGVLVDSTLIIDYIESRAAPGRSLMPKDPVLRRDALQHIGVALIGMEKAVQLIYELQHRPPELRHADWLERVRHQLEGAVALMESAVTAASLAGTDWLLGNELTQADITTAVAWRFFQHTGSVELDPAGYPGLAEYSARAEARPEFRACPLS